MTKKRHITAVCIALVLCFVLVFALAACKDKDKPGDDTGGGTTTTPTQDDTVRPYFTELSTALANSISADLVNGFNVGFTGSVTLGTDNYSFDLDANVLPKAADANKNFRLEVKQNDTLKFGLYNDQSNLYLTAYGYDGVKYNYNFSNASVMQALRAFLVINVPNYEGLPNLSDIDISGSSLKDTVRDLLPIGLAVLATDPDAEDPDASLRVAKEGNTYTLKLFLGNLQQALQQALPGVDLSALSGIVIDLKATVENNVVKGLSFGLSMNETAYAIAVESKNAGLFGPLNAELNAAVPQDLLETPAASVIQTDFSGKINISKTDDAGNASVVKSADWKLVSKIDLFTLIENNFMFSALPQDNFFHFQVSHTCDDTCSVYCEANLVSAKSALLGNRYKNTSIIDIAWSPSTMGIGDEKNNNLFIDVSLFDLVTVENLKSILSGALNVWVEDSVITMASSLLSSQLTFNVDLDAVVMKDNTIPRENATGGDDTPAPEPTPAPSIDIGKILGSLGGLANLDGGALNLNLAGVKNLIKAVAGEGAIIGTMTGDGLVDALFDTKNGISSLSLTCENNSFGHRADVANYNTYEKAVKYNANGDEKLKILYTSVLDRVGSNAYGSRHMSILRLGTQGSPALYTKSIETSGSNKYLNLYVKDGDDYLLVSDENNALTNYDLEVLYGGIKNLYFKYTYVDFNKAEKTAYGSVYGFQGLDLQDSGWQNNVTLLTSLMTGESFNTALHKNVGGLGAIFGGLDLPNLETILPFAADSFGGFRINFRAEVEPDSSKVSLVKEETEYKKVYDIDDTINTKATFEFRIGTSNNGKTYSFAATVTNNLVYDGFGMMVPGTYTITYTIDEKYKVNFPNGTNQMTETITVRSYDSVKIIANADLGLKTGENTGMRSKVLGTVEYTYSDGTKKTVDLKYSDYRSKLIVADSGFNVSSSSKITVATAGTYKLGIRLNEFAILYFDLVVTDPEPAPVA